MKTKYLFTALAMPALFAACTSEEFMAPQNGALNSDVLANRAKGELILDASRADALADATTRIVGEETAGGGISWLWEGKDDKIGATVVDYMGSTFPGASTDYVITNYPFAPGIEGPSKSANFSTPTAVVTGAYLFYNKYDGNNTDRRKLTSSLAGTIQAKAGVDEGLKQVGTIENGGQNFFISPIIDLRVKDGQAIQKPVELTSIYSVLKFRLNTELEDQYYKKGFRVNKIVLKSANGDNIFDRDITISPEKIQQVQKKVYDNLPANKKHLFKSDNYAINAMAISNAEVNEALDLVNAAFQNPKNEIGDLASADNELVYQLDEEFVFTEENKDAQLDVMVVLPSAEYTHKYGATYETKNKGIFLMTVYTSEGVYNSYIMNTVEKYTFERGKMYQMPVKTMKIGPGSTNVELVKQSEAFEIETTQDWNYAVTYINEHYRDYGSENNWTAPVLNLKGNVEIEGSKFYFPNYPVKYSGNKTLTLKGQNEYKIDPTKAIFDVAALPTIKIEGQTGAKVVFDNDIKAGIKATNGDAGTETIRLVTDAQIVIKEGKVVNFKSLESKNMLNVEKNAKMYVGSELFKTNGTFNVAEGATVSSEAKMENKANMTIAKNATVNVPGTSYNEGNIQVTGKLVVAGAFENKVGKTITIKSHEQDDLNQDSRGAATFETLNNKGTINIEKSANKKGTYGGLIAVTTLNNGVDNTQAVVNVNGELKANTVNNNKNAVINLQEDPYALIQIIGGVNDGTIVLTTPEKYEMFDNYYSQNNKLTPMQNGSGFIQATISSTEQFRTIKQNDNTYASQESAMEVLEKIILTGEVKVKFDGIEADMSDVDFVLDNATMIAEDNIAFANLTVNSASTLKTNKSGSGNVNVNIIATKGQVNVNADFTIDSRINLTIPVANESGNFIPNNTYAGSLNIYKGKLTNKGEINTSENNDKKALFAVVNSGATIENKGKIGYYHEGAAAYPTYYSQAELDIINALNAAYNAATKYYTRKIDAANVPEDDAQWNAPGIKEGFTMTVPVFRAWVKAGCPKYFVDGGKTFKVYADKSYTQAPAVSAVVSNNINNVFKTVKPIGDGTTVDVADLLSWANKDKTFTTADNLVKAFTPAVDPVLGHYLMVRKNFGTIDLTGAKWTVGGIGDNTKGTKKGEFSTNVLETGAVELLGIGAM